MTPDIRQILLNLITEYGHCLTRLEGERDMIKLIEARAIAECGVSSKAFRTVAVSHHRDQVAAVLDDLNSQVELFETVREENP